MPATNLTEGTRVQVYRDPRAETDLEGEAVLIERLNHLQGGCEYWRVRFVGQTETHRRVIRRPQ